MQDNKCNSYHFPFSALVGQELLKKALILNAVNPRIGGVLISGAKGTAKSSAVRALTQVLDGMQIVEVPLNTTPDKLVGSIDLEYALKRGSLRFSPGLLFKANNNILYIDEVNLLDDYLVEILLDAAASGINIVEREGLSHEHPARFIMVGTMNPEEGELRPQFLDRFGLYVEIRGIADIEQRLEIISRSKSFEDDPEYFCQNWRAEDENIRARISIARSILPDTQITSRILWHIADSCLKAGVQGHRADLVLAQTARAIAALNRRKTVEPNDVQEALPLVLGHRTAILPALQEPEHIEITDSKEKEQKELGNKKGPEIQEHPAFRIGSAGTPLNYGAEELIFGIGETFRVKSLQPSKDKILRKGSGRRAVTRTREKRGRYIGSAWLQGEDKPWDIALDATIRAAAPYQKRREKQNKGLVIEKSDLRTKIRKKNIGTSILFVVDASGSMGARERMIAVKGAVMSLLADAYQRRDKVGMVAFRRDSAELLLPLTRSVELAHKRLAELPTGGKTPLAEGLALGYEILLGELVKDPDIIPLMVIVTDGRANISSEGSDPFQAVAEIALKIKASAVETIVLDTENSFINLGMARKLWELLDGQYYRIEQLKGGE